ncbi:ABC transporter permease [Marmoricola sp. RAF53]|uniref:ABC transporter permease n=1 Tax=Marmoricola sp. RAF53 TaxID=3233059 RepID=UPI003F9EB75A
MSAFFSYTLTGLFTGAAYAIMASGLVLTYSTTRVFNIAHGAIGMVFAFVYWDLSQKQGMPAWLAMIVVLLLLAPAFGFFLQRVVVRDLGNAPIGVSLVVTVGLLVALIGVATQVWPTDARVIPKFFDGHFLHLGDNQMPWHQVITIIVSAIVALLLAALLTRTRIGTAMRASVDNPLLLRLYGGRPDLVAGLSWAIGCLLAALAGILLAAEIGLQYYDLTLLVISAYAAAMLGKLTSLPMTYLGAMSLGLAQAYVVGYLPNIPFADKVTGLPAVIPTVFLFIILVLLPQAPLRIGQVKGIVSAPVPSWGKAAGWGGALIVFMVLLSVSLSEKNLLLAGTAMTYAIVMLSLVVLTGFGGFVSLAQVTFAGVGAVAYAKLDEPNLFGLLAATMIAAAVGALVAIPVLRLTGLYLALATLAFAQLMDKLVFSSSLAFEIGNALNADRLSILGWKAEGTGTYTVLMTVMFVIVAFVVLAVRRGRLGRVLVAMRDSQAAVGTLGLDHRWVRVGVFAGSAAIAGLAGALFAGLRGTIVANDFLYFQSLLVLLMAVVWGVTSVTGALLGGVFMMYLPVAQSDHPDVAGLLFVVLGVGAVLLARDPNGLANKLFQIPGWIMNWLYPWLAERFPGMALLLREEPEEEEPVGAAGPSGAATADELPALTEEADDVLAAR